MATCGPPETAGPQKPCLAYHYALRGASPMPMGSSQARHECNRILPLTSLISMAGTDGIWSLVTSGEPQVPHSYCR